VSKAALLLPVVVLSAGFLTLSQQISTGSIAGTVRYVDGTPMFEHSVRATDEAGHFRECGSLVPWTEPPGHYQINGLSPGRYQVLFTLPGLVDEHRSVTVTAGGTVTLDVTMKPPPTPLYGARPHWIRLSDPGQALIGAWGWQGPITYQRERRDGVGEGFDYFRQFIVDEPFRWGANLLEFYPPDMQMGFPMPWPLTDPMHRPVSYWGGFLNPAWPPDTQRALVRYVHSKDWIVHVFCHPNLPGGPSPPVGFAWVQRPSPENLETEALQGTEHTWRDYSNPLAMGWQSSLDGFGYEDWFRDLEGSTIDVLWKYNPGSYIHSTQVLPAYTPNFSGTLMCAFGRAGWGNAAGFSDQWRHRFLPPGFLSYQADCRMRKPSTKTWDYWASFGGGSYPDWLLKQMNDFVRDRMQYGSALWWLGEPEETLPKPYRPYVYAASMDPIKAAYTWKLMSTGKGGYRDAIKAALANPPEGFGGEYEPRYDSAFIQNNYLRLYRLASEDRGILLYNRDHLAHYDKHADIAVDILEMSTGLLRTVRSHTTPPSTQPWSLQIGKPDGSGREFRQKGRYWRVFPFEIDRQQANEFPGRIGYETEPDWPSVVELNFDAPVGSYELEARQLGESGEPSTVGVNLNGEIAGVYGVKNDGGEAVHKVCFSVTHPGRQLLSLETLKGQGHQFDSLEIRRLKPEAVAFHYVEPGGHLAVMQEDVVVPGSFRERRVWRIQNDSPWLEVNFKRESTGHESVASVIDAGGFDTLLSGGQVQSASRHTGSPPKLLTLHDTSGNKPDLVVAVLEAGQVSSWTWAPGQRMEFQSPGGVAEQIRILFLVPDGLYDDRTIAALIGAMPNELEHITLGPSGTAVVRNELPVPRVAVVEIVDPNGEPYFVNETGSEGAHWSYRGGQPRASNHGASDFLKVYLAASSRATIQRYGFIRGVAKPGWGCQNLLQIADVDLRPNAATVVVTRLSPLIYAPRVQFSHPIRKVRLDGKPWQYFEDQNVFLPAARGRYRVEVEFGNQDAPRLTRTYANVVGAVWDATAKTLTISTESPAGYESGLPGGKSYTMLVRHRGFRLSGAQGAEPIPLSEYQAEPETKEAMRSAGTILRFSPGKSVLKFVKL